MDLTETDGLLKVLLVVQDAPEWANSGLSLAWRPAAPTLRPRQTLRWQINHRLVAVESWYYRLDTLNVAYAKSAPETFLHPPTHQLNERRTLR